MSQRNRSIVGHAFFEALDRRSLFNAVGLDPGFGDFGTTSAPFNGAVVMTTELDSGKILAVGSNTAAGTTKIAVARFTSGGAIDGTFGSNGVVLSSSGVDSVVDAALDSNGKIVVV